MLRSRKPLLINEHLNQDLGTSCRFPILMKSGTGSQFPILPYSNPKSVHILNHVDMKKDTKMRLIINFQPVYYSSEIQNREPGTSWNFHGCRNVTFQLIICDIFLFSRQRWTVGVRENSLIEAVLTSTQCLWFKPKYDNEFPCKPHFYLLKVGKGDAHCMDRLTWW